MAVSSHDPPMIIVDSNPWADFFNGASNPHVQRLAIALQEEEDLFPSHTSFGAGTETLAATVVYMLRFSILGRGLTANFFVTVYAAQAKTDPNRGT